MHEKQSAIPARFSLKSSRYFINVFIITAYMGSSQGLFVELL